MANSQKAINFADEGDIRIGSFLALIARKISDKNTLFRIFGTLKFLQIFYLLFVIKITNRIAPVANICGEICANKVYIK